MPLSDVKSDIITRIEEENKQRPSEIPRVSLEIPDVLEDSEDDEFEDLQNFRIGDAWNTLLKMPECYQVMISPEIQKHMGIEVGINVSQEFPWKNVKFMALQEHLFDGIENGEKLKAQFEDYALNDTVLIGYIPTLTQDLTEPDVRDPFIIFTSTEATYNASQTIKNIELYERWTCNKMLIKRGKFWKSFGSEQEIDLTKPKPRTEMVDIEIQSVYPMKQSSSAMKLQLRKSSDVRDGYVELLPGEKKFENIFRKRVDLGLQSAPERIPLEQQTEPTFPTNAWTQYLYEITGEDEGLDESSEDEQHKTQRKDSKAATPLPEETVEEHIDLSDKIDNLVQTLEFNQIDMYRNDYPLISDVSIPKFTNPYLEEILCFADISKSYNRYVCGVDWYPTTSGLLATSYTFTTPVTSVSVNDKTDDILRIILNRHIVLMWSFSDSLNSVLELESPIQVCSLSFCPYQPNLLIGGGINGQVILWDLQDRVKKLNYEEMLTTVQAKYRAHMAKFLEWTKHVDEQFTVYSAFVSALNTSQTGPITTIKWLPQTNYITADGKVRDALQGKLRRCFLTNSVDGTIAFWDLDIKLGKKIKSGNTRANLPPELVASESPFHKYDRLFKPVFKVAHAEPIVTTISDCAMFNYKPYNYSKFNQSFYKSYPIKVTAVERSQKKKDKREKAIRLVKENSKNEIEEIDLNDMNDEEEDNEPKSDQRYLLMSSSFFGKISKYSWTGFDYDLGDPVNQEKVTKFNYFGSCHDGPIVAMEQNPHLPEIFASVGRYILAIWKDDFLLTPILWRKRPSEITNVKWSTDRPAVLYLTRVDGYFEAWDIFSRDDDPCLVDALGGGIITAISEHRPNIPKKVLGIGDFNSSFRMIVLPPNFQEMHSNETWRLENFIAKEENRKKAILKWEKNWSKKNKDIQESKKAMNRVEIQQELEVLQKDAGVGYNPCLEKYPAAKETGLRRVNSSSSKLRLTIKSEANIPMKKIEEIEKKGSIELIEKLEKKWDEMNTKRLLDALMARKTVNAEKLEKDTAMEKQRLAYEKSKRKAMKKSWKKVAEEVAAIRARLLPVEKLTTEIDLINDSIYSIIKMSDKYNSIEKEMNDLVEVEPIEAAVSFSEFLGRGSVRRKLIDKSLGVNTTRPHYYKACKLENRLKEFCFGYEALLSQPVPEESESAINILSFSDLDEIPVKDES